ncbi:MAG: bifunctional 5,10-methylene-tetrahydrofolate dehydrogenase/5,10-methylene-tetrahydrofolate cyclohydrolase [Proteobacteria bacterium]|nr:bifunctional 5,10-methylene-tetrahydrofolate dehydrogenase/5,10-methylene-tetrahydrofolate cyclohydrolase [SAR86 cluster bacterium]MDA0345543.1 bifunctional 5,10-methylene-tetrahydrofolate dehydrogenase/5,10-methylene-tetrahydrofolate cyclohydrolase [Pseudomonadota bacterium]MDA0899530.1 bifunctional 5,10-methylene-tetrahydrofolate dehydrogenase/5,10-methylene-tetrahydrofolate cyclohydrolase [Pseudomonadota bacterium]MDA1056377.1 bifunctional 5,10-methylene-tetrahydrofolate dehydrogenase/5,10
MANSIILDGKSLAEKSNLEIAKKAKILTDKFKRPPALSAIIVGEDPASKTYVAMKEKACTSLGVKTITHHVPEQTTTKELLDLIESQNLDSSIDGILLQHPAPNHIDEQKCFNAIALHKDVDGVSTQGYGNMVMGLEAFKSCTPFGIMRLLENYKIDCSGKLALVIGRSQILGKPMSALLLNADATVITAHSKTKNLDNLISDAEIVVAAVGIPNFISCKMLRKGSVLVDAGYHPSKKCGDVDMEGIEDIVSAYTPVPGGVGPMTINTLILNTVNAMEKNCSEQ